MLNVLLLWHEGTADGQRGCWRLRQKRWNGEWYQCDKPFPNVQRHEISTGTFIADYLTKNNIELNAEVSVRKDELMQDTWSPMLNTFEGERSFTECQTGKDRLPAAVPTSAKVVHKTGTEYPLPSGQPSGICDVGIIILNHGQQFPIAVFITNPSSQSKISEASCSLSA